MDAARIVAIKLRVIFKSISLTGTPTVAARIFCWMSGYFFGECSPGVSKSPRIMASHFRSFFFWLEFLHGFWNVLNYIMSSLPSDFVL